MGEYDGQYTWQAPLWDSPYSTPVEWDWMIGEADFMPEIYSRGLYDDYVAAFMALELRVKMGTMLSYDQFKKAYFSVEEYRRRDPFTVMRVQSYILQGRVSTYAGPVGGDLPFIDPGSTSRPAVTIWSFGMVQTEPRFKIYHERFTVIHPDALLPSVDDACVAAIMVHEYVHSLAWIPDDRFGGYIENRVRRTIGSYSNAVCSF
jgi:hypothetical protein